MKYWIKYFLDESINTSLTITELKLQLMREGWYIWEHSLHNVKQW